MDIFLKYLSMNFKAKLQYKTSFILLTISNILVIFVGIFTVYLLFSKFGLFDQYNIYEILLSFSVVYFGFSFTDFLGRGFDKFSDIIKKGDLDIILLRPRNIYMQIFGTNIAFERMSKFIISLIILIYILFSGNYNLNILKIITIIFASISSALLFMGIIFFASALTFKTVEGLEFINIFQYGGRQFGQYPMGIFPKIIKNIFTYIFPLTLINYYPLSFVLGKTNNILYMLAPFGVLIFFILSIVAFEFGLKHYTSTGS